MKKGMRLALCAALSISAAQCGFMDTVAEVGNSAMGKVAHTESPEKKEQSSPISLLTKNLGVDSKQAAGGTAALLGAAASAMPKENFDKIVSSVPGLSSLSSGGAGGMLGSALSMAGGTDIAKSFEALGMDSKMVSKFAPLLLEYAKPYLDSKNLSLLQQAWKAFM